MSDPGPRLPLIVLVAPDHGDVLGGEFPRYARDYDIRSTVSATETSALLQDARVAGVPVALVVTESRLPDMELFPAFAAWRAIVPTAGTPPADLETSVPGVFAAGDVRASSMKRVAAASGEGASVIPLVHAFLARI